MSPLIAICIVICLPRHNIYCADSGIELRRGRMHIVEQSGET